MNLDTYPVTSDASYRMHEFLSEGIFGTVKKIVLYEIIYKDVFNLSFGDWDETIQKIDDLRRSNNGDTGKVLATVAFTVLTFLKYHPGAILYIEGSTSSRTRLYQMEISRYWHIINHLLDIKGCYQGQWLPFERSKNFQAFMVKTK